MRLSALGQIYFKQAAPAKISYSDIRKAQDSDRIETVDFAPLIEYETRRRPSGQRLAAYLRIQALCGNMAAVKDAYQRKPNLMYYTEKHAEELAKDKAENDKIEQDLANATEAERNAKSEEDRAEAQADLKLARYRRLRRENLPQKIKQEEAVLTREKTELAEIKRSEQFPTKQAYMEEVLDEIRKVYESTMPELL